MQKHLLAEFVTTNKKEWVDKIIKDLRSKSFEELDKEVQEKWELSAFLSKEDINNRVVPIDLPATWTIIQDFRNSNATTEDIIHALEAGAQGIHLTAEQFKSLKSSKDIFWHMITVLLDDAHEVPHADMEFDRLCKDQIEVNNALFPLVFKVPSTQDISIPNHLADWLSEIVLQLDALEPEQALTYLKQVWHAAEVGPSYLVEIAKLRAMRILWDQLLEDYQLNANLLLHTPIGKAVADASPYQNMINYSCAALSAVIGGADMINIAELEGEDLSTDTKSRISRNIQHLLQLESHLDKVKDPAAGSYVIESLTQRLASKAWSLFLEKMGSA